ncbi:MAG: hypothetical protein R2685_02510 [Candidatus Nitrosocosmicus sp.]|nr:hypothetical protein [Candidatus Nitrosocosmicus sp.]
MPLLENVNYNGNNSLVQLSYGHNFAPNNYAAFLSSIDQFQTEANLARENLVNNDTALAQQHVNEANSIFYWDLMAQIANSDNNISDNMKSAIDNLTQMSSSFTTSSQSTRLQENQLKQMDQLINNLDLNAYSVINLTLAQKQSEDHNVFNQIAALLTGLFTGQNGSSTDNSLQPLRFVELVDKVLRNYGDAYDVKFDMTDMTNMANMPMTNSNTSATTMTNNSNMSNHSSKHMSASTTNLIAENDTASIANIANYQTAEGLTEKLIQLFHKELIPLKSDNKPTPYLNNVENGLNQLLWSIQNRATPMNVMMIVHTQIHPNLIEAFNLQLR